MRQGTKVNVLMTRGSERSGKFVREESNRGVWYVIRDAAGAEFKARPSRVIPA